MLCQKNQIYATAKVLSSAALSLTDNFLKYVLHQVTCSVW